MKTVLNDVESHNLTLTEAVNMAQNRPISALWRLLAASGATQWCKPEMMMMMMMVMMMILYFVRVILEASYLMSLNKAECVICLSVVRYRVSTAIKRYGCLSRPVKTTLSAYDCQ